MRVITWNTWHGLSGGGLIRFGELETPDRRSFRFEHQVEILKSSQPDFVCLQELNPYDQMSDQYATALGLEAFAIKDNTGLKWQGLGIPYNLNSGLAILSKPPWKLVKKRIVKLSGGFLAQHQRFYSLQFKEARFGQFGLYSHPEEGRIWVGNLHLHHGFQVPYGPELDHLTEGLTPAEAQALVHFLSAGERRRSQEIDRVLRFLGTLSTEPVMLCGDFNGDSSSVPYKKLKRYGFLDLWRELRRDEPGYTWDRDKNPENHRYLDEFVSDLKWESLEISEAAKSVVQKRVEELQAAPRRIDFVFVKSPLVPIEVGRVMLLGTEGQSSTILPSDHFGILADWWLKTGDETPLPE